MQERDIPACDAGTPDSDCTYRWEYTGMFATAADCARTVTDAEGSSVLAGGTTGTAAVSEHRELAFLRPHLHEGGLSIKIIDATTNATICHAVRAHGATHSRSA